MLFSYSKLHWGNGFMCQIGDTGHLGLCTWNFEVLKNLSIFLSIYFLSEKQNWNK